MKIISAHHCCPERWMLTLVHAGHAYLFHSGKGELYTVIRSRQNAIAPTRCACCDERYRTLWYSYERETLAAAFPAAWDALVADPTSHLLEILL